MLEGIVPREDDSYTPRRRATDPAVEELVLSKREIDRLKSILGKKAYFVENPVGRFILGFFEFIDLILDKTSRLWMYGLEFIGVYMLILNGWRYDRAVVMVEKATDQFTVDQGTAIANIVKMAVESEQLLFAGLCVGIPAIIGVLRSRKSPPPSDVPPVTAPKNTTPPGVA